MRELILDARKLGDFGIGTYISEIFNGIIRSGEFQTTTLTLKSGSGLEIPKDRQVTCRAPNYHPLEQVEIPWRLRRHSRAPYFSPHYLFPYFLKNPLIVTIHDLIHFKFPHFFKPAIKVKMAGRFIEAARERARLVLTVSQQTKRDLCQMFRFEEEQVAVVHNGVSELFFSQPQSGKAPERPYLLFIGNPKPHKNLTRLIEAFGDFARQNGEIDLVLAGAPPDQEMRAQIVRMGIRDRVRFPGYLSTSQLIEWIDQCLFFVFPSLYEGFGLPPLEAMSRGKAVLSSDAGSLGEILGQAAFYVDPSDTHSILLGIRLLAGDINLRQQLERLGQEHSRAFTWSESVEKTLDLLKTRL